MKEVRVRFAPSPTGFLHVGGARTAIFNWLFAKNQGGRFLLRIEDTDPERSKSELSAQILRSMEWLQMTGDEPVVYQTDAANIKRYKETAEELISTGKAYYAFETSEELDAQRKAAHANKAQYKYNRASHKLSKDTVEKYLAEGKEYTVRFFVPEGVTEFEDLVHGKTIFQNSEIDDFVILRSDGSPIYQLAVVVDDYDMKISHVIRGDDHLSNTPKQILLYKAMGWEVPIFAHLPMILDEQKKKLSKRRNTVSVEEYKEQGYLPEALFNFLTLLGYAPENKREVIPKDELVKEFSFERVNKKSAVFDTDKLKWINSEYIKNTDEKILAGLIREKITEKKILPPEDAEKISDDYLYSVIRLMKERVYTINDFVEFGKYFFVAPLEYDKKGIEKHFSIPETKESLSEFLKILGENKDFNSAKLEEKLREFTDFKGIKAGIIIHPLRLALTGITISPGIFELMEILGKDSTILRINKILSIH